MEVITTIHKKGEGRAQSSGLTLADVFVVRNRKTEWRAQLLVEKFCNNSTLAVNFQNQSTSTKVSHFNKEVLTRLLVCHPQEIACKRILYRLSYWRLIDCRFETKMKVNRLVQLGKTGNRFQMNTTWLSHYLFVFDITSPKLVWRAHITSIYKHFLKRKFLFS